MDVGLPPDSPSEKDSDVLVLIFVDFYCCIDCCLRLCKRCISFYDKSIIMVLYSFINTTTRTSANDAQKAMKNTPLSKCLAYVDFSLHKLSLWYRPLTVTKNSSMVVGSSIIGKLIYCIFVFKHGRKNNRF
jgi:hypothetical protein